MIEAVSRSGSWCRREIRRAAMRDSTARVPAGCVRTCRRPSRGRGTNSRPTAPAHAHVDTDAVTETETPAERHMMAHRDAAEVGAVSDHPLPLRMAGLDA